MIISASRRTDIPAFYSDWFMERLDAGYVDVSNPFNPAQVRRVSLRPEDVDAIVFWSKDPRPLMARLRELASRGYKYYFQFTVNDYPLFEPNVPPLSHRLETFRALSDSIGPDRVIWRYDPIIVSSATPREYHLERIDRIATALAGRTNRLVISFLDFYAKTRRRLSQEAATFRDIARPEYREELLGMARDIKGVSDANGLEVVSCAEVDLDEAGIPHGACVDADLMRKLWGSQKPFTRVRNQRARCLCAVSVDIGAYNTCRHGCVYCYAS